MVKPFNFELNVITGSALNEIKRKVQVGNLMTVGAVRARQGGFIPQQKPYILQTSITKSFTEHLFAVRFLLNTCAL
jgi:hypothetical protein